jgi:probable F420-dependent oxidoreductase
MIPLPPFGVWVGRLALEPAAVSHRVAKQLEEAGAGVLWISEAFGKEALAHAASLLAVTERVVVATGIASVWSRDAVAAVNGARTLEDAYPGRFVLGLGVSHAPLVRRRGGAYASPIAAMRGYLDALEAAIWMGPEVPTPPVLLAALGDGMLRLAAERADGAHPYLVTPEHTARARSILGPDLFLAPEQAVALTDDEGAARSLARQHLEVYLGLDNYRRSLRRQGFTEEDLADGGSDRLLDGLVAWGSPGAVVERLRAHRAAGADHVAVQLLTEEVQQIPAAWRTLAAALTA